MTATTDLALRSKLAKPKTCGAAFLDRYTNPRARKTMRAALVAVLHSIDRILAANGDAPISDVGPEAFPWEQVSYDVAQKIRGDLMPRYKPRSVAGYLGALRGVLRVAVRLGLYPRAEFDVIAERGGPLSRPREETIPAGRMLTPEEIRSILDAPRAGTYADRRDVAILALAAYTGLRRAEIAGLDVEDVRADGTLRVRGKGGRERTVVVPVEAARRLAAHVKASRIGSGPLFPRARRGGHLGRDRITPNGVAEVVSRAVKLLPEHATAHDFRRTFASTLIDAGVDLPTIADLMGHRSIETTRKYDRRGEERKRRAAAVLDNVFGKEK